MNARPTLPVQPWEIPAKVPDTWTRRPSEAEIKAAQERLAAGHKPVRKPADDLVGRVFMGRLNASDMDYMAKAILQLADENHELRERVRRLEERLGL